MTRINNYAIQAQQAKQLFLTYDQQQIIDKCRLVSDDQYIYVNFLCKLYRIRRYDAFTEYQSGSQWLDGNSFEEVMTLLDLLCDSQPGRWISGRWKSMESFGRAFHRNLLEDAKDPVAEGFSKDPEKLRRVCLSLSGVPIPGADVGYAIELFDGLRIGLQLFLGDDEFPSRIRYLWDENALQYLKYETMYFAIHLLMRRIQTEMDFLP